ncbi:uncharacterized protein LOC144422999 [Styela clava]
MITYTCERGRRLVGPLPLFLLEITCPGPIPDVSHSAYHQIVRPYGGRKSPVSNWPFPLVNDVVEYTCEEGFLLTGEPPKCQDNTKWSTHTTQCIEPRYPHTDFGRSISANATEGQEIYFLFDVSASVIKQPKDIKYEIEFAKRLVKRMEGFKGSIHIGIFVFASECVMILNIFESTISPKSAEQILLTLDKVYVNAADRGFRRAIRSGTATANALFQLENMIELMNNKPGNANNKRHCFIFTDACRHCQEGASLNELVGLSSKGGENYIYIEDFYQIQSYLDRITDLKLDFEKYGQSGDVGSIKQRARSRRSTGGEDAAENAWPWQALITVKSATPERVKHK